MNILEQIMQSMQQDQGEKFYILFPPMQEQMPPQFIGPFDNEPLAIEHQKRYGPPATDVVGIQGPQPPVQIVFSPEEHIRVSNPSYSKGK